MGSRDPTKGEAAVKAIKDALPAAKIELLQVDVGSDASVSAAASTVGAGLGDEKLFAVVNNAGTGLAHAGVDSATMVNTNLYGPKRMVEAFLPLLGADGRIVNVGSGAGPSFIKKCTSPEVQKTLCSESTWEQIEAAVKAGLPIDPMKGYGVSKAALTTYTMLLARTHPAITSSCVTPGFIDTAIVKGFGASKPPEEGTVSIRHALFEKLGGNGWYLGSDAVRSPLHFMRNPGEPPYDGTPPF